MTGKLFLILGPSGSGKGTVLEALHAHHSEFVFPISCTTRLKRPHEKDGTIYYFISREEFKRRIQRGDFLEYAVVHGENYYGTLKAPILKALEEGKTVVREVDVQGLRSIRQIIPKQHLISIFLTVPDWEILHQRIVKRSKMSLEEMERRHASYLEEMKWQRECDHVVESREGQQENVIAEVEKIILNDQ